jgi:hypothetical protein
VGCDRTLTGHAPLLACMPTLFVCPPSFLECFVSLSCLSPTSHFLCLRTDTKDKALATGGTFCAFFCHARDMLFVLLSRELLVFDLELGVPAGG